MGHYVTVWEHATSVDEPEALSEMLAEGWEPYAVTKKTVSVEACECCPGRTEEREVFIHHLRRTTGRTFRTGDGD